jgi:hypothetical protein
MILAEVLLSPGSDELLKGEQAHQVDGVANGGFQRLQNMGQAEQVLALGADSFLGSLVVSSVNHGERASSLAQESLFAAVMKNRYCGRYFRAVLAYLVGVSGGWNQRAFRGLGVDLTPGGGGQSDDWTDLSLFLYARDGDVILSADGLVRALARIIDPEELVRVCTAQVRVRP